ncbi:unnamed protein product, partial [Bubo scandiacus]
MLAPWGTAGAVVFAHSAARQLRRSRALARHGTVLVTGAAPAAQREGRFCGGFVRFPAGWPAGSARTGVPLPAVAHAQWCPGAAAAIWRLEGRDCWRRVRAEGSGGAGAGCLLPAGRLAGAGREASLRRCGRVPFRW